MSPSERMSLVTRCSRHNKHRVHRLWPWKGLVSYDTWELSSPLQESHVSTLALVDTLVATPRMRLCGLRCLKKTYYVDDLQNL